MATPDVLSPVSVASQPSQHSAQQYEQSQNEEKRLNSYVGFSVSRNSQGGRAERTGKESWLRKRVCFAEHYTPD